MSKDFLSAVAERRTFYSISKETTISDERIEELVAHAIKHTPSAFNSQSARAVVLLGNHHDKVWDITKSALRKILPDDQFVSSEARINSFQSGYGTVLFFEDQSVIAYLQKEFALYKDNFPVWSQQASGMHQFVVWTAFENEGLGVSLQHYNELIENDVHTEWNLPTEWKLIAQMPFGKPTEQPQPKEFQPLEHRIKVYK